MKIYYKARLKQVEKSKKAFSKDFMGKHGFSYIYKSEYEKVMESIDKDRENKFHFYCSTHNQDAMDYFFTSEELTKIFKDDILLFFPDDGISDTIIIFEIVESTKGIKYAKELLTGLLFPLEGEKIVKGTEFIDNGTSIHAKLTIGMKMPGLAKASSIITVYDVASIGDVKNYLDFNKNITDINDNTISKSVFKKNIIDYYNMNAFSEDIVLNPSVESQVLNPTLASITHIKYYLNLLEKINPDKASELNNQFDNIIKVFDDKTIMNPISAIDLLELENKIRFYTIFNKETNGLLSEINKFENSSDETININDLDNLFDIFLKYKDNCTMEEQKFYLEELAKLYILVIKHDNLSYSFVEKGHFNDLIYIIAAQLKIDGSSTQNLSALDVLDAIINLNNKDETKKHVYFKYN